ncbi:ATP synthase regulation protein NCA2-domain-containing protein [Chytriomyces cf. hyalinus JEL632]|nr:ATP synthase regulation protein NCA2-domain-containing protein [Chytriomyces cf. hyalinus JEL632]
MSVWRWMSHSESSNPTGPTAATNTQPLSLNIALNWAHCDVRARVAALLLARHEQASVLGALALAQDRLQASASVQSESLMGTQLQSPARAPSPALVVASNSVSCKHAERLVAECVQRLARLPSSVDAYAKWAARLANLNARLDVFDPIHFDALDALNSSTDSEQMSKEECDALYARMDTRSGEMQSLSAALANIQTKYGTPTWFQQYWIHSVAGASAALVVASSLSLNARSIRTLGTAIVETAKSLAEDYIFLPLKQMYSTIRHRERRLALMGSDSLNADLESLERMVVEFAKDHGVLSGTDLEAIRGRAERGDLSVVLRSYEDELKHPISGALKGDLVRSLLIQVQKSKVDLELAMSALDKLLQANELNFTIMSMIPLALLGYFGLRSFKAFLRRRAGTSREQRYQVVRSSLREVERLLNRASLPPSSVKASNGVGGAVTPRSSTIAFVGVSGLSALTLADYGLLLVELDTLEGLVGSVPKSVRSRFVEDLDELSHVGWSVSQRMETAKRMSRDFREAVDREN